MSSFKKILPPNGLLSWIPIYLSVINIIVCGMYLISAELIKAEICVLTVSAQGALIFLILYLKPYPLRWSAKCNERCIIAVIAVITLAPAVFINAGFLGLLWGVKLSAILGAILNALYFFVFRVLPRWERENYHKQLATSD